MGDQKTLEAKSEAKPAARQRHANVSARADAASPVPSCTADGFADAWLKHPTSVRPRAAILRKAQRQRGNAFVQRALGGGASAPDAAVERALNDRSAGTPLDPSTQREFGALLGNDLAAVRVHTDVNAARLARDVNALAFTRGRDIYFGEGEYRPTSSAGRALLSHELVHTVQQQSGRSGAMAHTASPDDLEREAERAALNLAAGEFAGPVSAPPQLEIQRQDIVEVELIESLTEYRPPGSNEVYRVGDAAGPNILMRIERMGEQLTFRWYNFAAGQARSARLIDWDFLRGAAIIGGGTGGFASLGRLLTPAQWQSLWPDPVPELLRMHEEGRITLPDDTILTSYRGMVYTEAERTLDENERRIDQLLNAPDRVAQIQEYATGLAEAAVVRDALEARRDELRQRLVQQHSFTFGLAGNIINMDPYRRIQVFQELAPVEASLDFWYRAFPLLTRLRTSEIHAARVEQELRTIKANIIATRADLEQAQVGRGPLDLMNLDMVRAQLSDRLGARARRTIEAEDASRRRWAWVRGGALFAGGIALLFLPGGIFIDAAIGVAIAAKAWYDAAVIGRAANTGMHVDDGLISQAHAQAAVFEAVLATVLAAVGVAAASFRVIRVGRAFMQVRAAAPELELGAQARLARLIAQHPEIIRTLRTTTELETVLRDLHIPVNFEELQALRAVAYRVRGVQLPTYSRESLDAFLDNVWANRVGISRREISVYRLYSNATEANPLTRAPQEYTDALLRLGRERPPGAVSNIQDNLSTGFFRFERSGADLTRIQERIYLNVNADRAPEVMRYVVRDIVDNPRAFPGVGMAKVTGPGAVSGRADTIVIYVENQQAAQRVLQQIRQYHTANPADFRMTTPAMTNRVLEGVSVGSEPLNVAGQASFGSVRANIITEALRASVRQNETREQFVQRALELLRQRGINPEAPHLNLPPGGTP